MKDPKNTFRNPCFSQIRSDKRVQDSQNSRLNTNEPKTQRQKMGCSESQLSDPHAKRVDALLREEDKLMKNTVHCLLLGAGDSGKSYVALGSQMSFDIWLFLVEVNIWALF